MTNLLATFAIDNFLPIAKWVVIGVVAAVIIALVLAFFIKRELFPKVAKILLLSLFFFLLAIGLACLIMEIAKSFSPEYALENWLDRTAIISYVLIPISVLIFIILASGVSIFIVSKKSSQENKEKNVKKTTLITGIISLVALIVSGVLIAVYYDLKFKNDGYYNSDTASVNQPVLYVSAILIIITLIALAFILDRNKKGLDTRCIAMAGITVAMSFGLSYIKLFELPQGGSVTLFSLLPIMIFSYMYGTKKGVFVCLIYGVLQAVQDPWIIHPAQFILDYPVAFASIGLSGVFRGIQKLEKFPQVTFLMGGIIASVLRFICHVLSGVFAFSAYAEGLNPWIYSLGYNSFVFVDIAIVLVIGVIVFSSKAFIKELSKIENK